MAAFFGANITLTGTVQNLYTVLLAASALPASGQYVRAATIQPFSTNSNPVYVGPSTVADEATAYVYLVTGMSFSAALDATGAIDLTTIYVIGTADEKIHVSLLG